MTPFCGDLRVLRSVLQAIYPTVIIVLVALKRSPIDTGGLSQVCLAPDHRADLGSSNKKARNSATVIFHHSAFCGSSVGDTEGAEGDGHTGHPDDVVPPRKSSVSEGEANCIDNIV